MEDFAVNVVPGPGLIARWHAGIAVAGGPSEVAGALLEALQDELGPDPSVVRLIELLRTDERFSSAATDLAVAVSTPDGVRVFVRGNAQARTETNELIAGTTPLERDLPGAAALWLGCVDPPSTQGHPILDLRLGIVPGGGAVVHRSARTQSPGLNRTGDHRLSISGEESVQPPQPPKAPPSQIAAEPEPEVRPFEAVNWDEPLPVEERTPLAVLDDAQSADTVQEIDAREVLGITCSRGHFNNPKAGYCQVCGISMIHLTHRLEPGVRPTLGFVVFADGATYALDRPYLIGRNPQPTPESGCTPLATQDSSQSVSREHAKLDLEDWDVVYIDLGSTNGSFLWDPSTAHWSPIAPNAPLVLTSGSTVSVGRMTFVFEGASKAIGGQ